MHILMTRPESGLEPDPIRDALRAAGHRIMQAPLLSVTFTGAMPSLKGAQALIATSRNGLRAVAPIPGDALALPIFAVGPATAALAQRLGFRRIIEGPGTGRELADVIRAEIDPAAGALIHLASDTLAFDLKGALTPLGFDVRTETVYRTEIASALPPEVADTLRRDELDAVLLMSPRTARVYTDLVATPALAAAARRLRHFCLSDAVAAELSPLGSVSVAVARLPNAQEMLALIARDAPDSP